MFKGWISRQVEAELPAFADHEEAKAYFREKYGDAFIVQSVEEIDGQSCYFCALIVDRETFYAGRRKLMLGNAVMGMEFLKSYQPIEIMEDGNIHIIH